MCRRTPHHGIASGFTVMNVKTMNYNIGNILNCDAASISNVDIGTPSINSLEAVYNEFLLQLYHHVPLEDNPERPVLNNSMAQSARPWVNRVIVSGISDNIKPTITTTNSISAKSNATVCKALPVTLPVGVTTPAIINGVTSSTREKSELSPFCAVLDAPVISNTF